MVSVAITNYADLMAAASDTVVCVAGLVVGDGLFTHPPADPPVTLYTCVTPVCRSPKTKQNITAELGGDSDRRVITLSDKDKNTVCPLWPTQMETTPHCAATHALRNCMFLSVCNASLVLPCAGPLSHLAVKAQAATGVRGRCGPPAGNEANVCAQHVVEIITAQCTDQTAPYGCSKKDGQPMELRVAPGSRSLVDCGWKDWMDGFDGAEEFQVCTLLFKLSNAVYFVHLGLFSRLSSQTCSCSALSHGVPGYTSFKSCIVLFDLVSGWLLVFTVVMDLCVAQIVHSSFTPPTVYVFLYFAPYTVAAHDGVWPIRRQLEPPTQRSQILKLSNKKYLVNL